MKDVPVVIVTGASRGVGAAVARWLGKARAGVALMARSEESLRRVAADVEGLGGVPWRHTGDVADPGVCRRAVQKTIERFGRLDAVVNNAGIFQPITSIARADPDAWRYTIEVNLLGAFYLTHAAIPALKQRSGRILNVTSGAANIPIAYGSAYCASKSALNHFTRVLAAEEPTLTTIAIRPGIVDTDMQELIRREGPKIMPPQQMAYYQGIKEQGQLEPPAIPGRSIAWLALHAPRSWSGECLDYDDPRIFRPSSARFGNRFE